MIPATPYTPPPRDPRFAQLNERIASERSWRAPKPESEPAKHKRRVSEIAQSLKCEPWQIRRAWYLAHGGQTATLEREGLTAIAAGLGSLKP